MRRLACAGSADYIAHMRVRARSVASICAVVSLGLAAACGGNTVSSSSGGMDAGIDVDTGADGAGLADVATVEDDALVGDAADDAPENPLDLDPCLFGGNALYYKWGANPVATAVGADAFFRVSFAPLTAPSMVTVQPSLGQMGMVGHVRRRVRC